MNKAIGDVDMMGWVVFLICWWYMKKGDEGQCNCICILRETIGVGSCAEEMAVNIEYVLEQSSDESCR